MKFRVEFNDGKTFSHYALVVFKVGLNITYVCSGVLMFGMFFMNASEHIKEIGPEIIEEVKQFYFSDEETEQDYIDCMNCDEID
tara:strand:+ start:1442 stop:1693 length:252 start_codon:yes stop_codon:yes gene_type:complete